MSLNPIVALSEQLQKLINERGSSAILRDHLALFKDQVLLLEKENLRLVNECGTYKINNEKLNSDIEHLQQENEELRSKIQRYEQPTEQTAHDHLLEETKVNILLYLYKNPKSTEPLIAQVISMGMPVAEFHLKELRETKMAKRVIGGSAMRPENGWSLDQEGTRYLIAHQLI